MLGYSRCHGCNLYFWYVAGKVPRVPVEHPTGLPVTRPGDDVYITQEALCPACCKLANVERAAKGLELLDEQDTMGWSWPSARR
jgi:hypothetical protein